MLLLLYNIALHRDMIWCSAKSWRILVGFDVSAVRPFLSAACLSLPLSFQYADPYPACMLFCASTFYLEFIPEV
jgi:hypothetical protein